MMRSLYSGVSGLQNHQTRMDVIGNNISNVNTTGFKKGRVNFQDMLSQTVTGAARPTDNKGGVNPKQVGLGMMVASIDTIHTQGSLQTTSNKLDLAISGNGFFVLKDGDKTFYTRAGIFNLDKNGVMVNPGTGLKVQGWMSEEINGVDMINTASDAGDITVPLYSKDPAKATRNVDFKCNLDQSMPAQTMEEFNALPPEEQVKRSWTSSINVFDKFGNPIEARFRFVKTDVNQWQADLNLFQIDPENPQNKIAVDTGTYSLDVNPSEGENIAPTDGQTSFNIEFDNLGRILSVYDQNQDIRQGDPANPDDKTDLFVNLDMIIPSAEAGLAPDGSERMQLQINLGQALSVANEEGVGVTQFSSGFSTKPFRQDGNAMGYMEDIKIDDTGTITGVYSNGNNRALAQVALANFANVGGLEKAGETNFVYSNNSGEPDVGAAGTVGKGKIIAGALEMSNVDLAEQFTDMIVTQRGFQSNSKTIQTSDQMLQELLTLKR